MVDLSIAQAELLMESRHKQQLRPFVVLNLQKHSSLEAGTGVMPAKQATEVGGPSGASKSGGRRAWFNAIGIVQSKTRIIGSDTVRATSCKA